MAVECVDSSIYVSKILSERRKVGVLFKKLHFFASSFLETCKFVAFVPKSSLFTIAGEKTFDGKNASSKNQ